MKNINCNIVVVRPILGDEKDLVFVHKKTWLATYPNKKYKIFKNDILLKDFDSEKKINAWREIIKNNGKDDDYLNVAKNEGVVIGFCLVSKKKKYNEVKIIYILPEYQGMGIGQKLLDDAIIWLGRKEDIVVAVATYNENAINFYKKYGFSKTGFVSNVELPNGKKIPEIQLILSRP